MLNINEKVIMESSNISSLTNKEKEIIVQAIDKIINLIKSPEEFEDALKNSFSPNSELVTSFPSICIILGECMDLLSNKEEWEKISYEYMGRLRKIVYRYNEFLGAGLFGGLCDLGFGAYALYKGTTYYKKFIDSLNNLIIDRVKEMLIFYKGFKGKVFTKQYDAISGFSGILGYLILFKEQSEIESVIISIIEYFIEISKEVDVAGHKVPGWYVCSENQYLMEDKIYYKEGNFNLGLAHGISGIAAALSLALNNGFDLPGQREVIKLILNDLKRFKHRSKDGAIYWNGRVDFRSYIEEGEGDINITRAGWCYGTPGIARTMYISGMAVGDNESVDISIEALKSICNMKEDEWDLDSPIICHGLAGLLSIVNLMYEDTKVDAFKLGREKILSSLLKYFDSDSLFGFKDTISIEDNDGNPQKKEVDKIAFLEGSSGVILSILSIIKPSISNWERHLLIN